MLLFSCEILQFEQVRSNIDRQDDAVSTDARSMLYDRVFLPRAVFRSQEASPAASAGCAGHVYRHIGLFQTLERRRPNVWEM